MDSQTSNSVIKNLLSRKNRVAPFKDKRRITLVLYGGVMTGIRGAGAMIALKELGLSHAFDEIYSFSAGFCNASYLLSGNPEEGTSLYYDDLSGKKFINFLRIWKVADIEYVIDCMKEKKPLHLKNIFSNKTKLFVQVENMEKKEIDFLEVHKHSISSYFSLVRAAIRMPFLSPGGTKIGSGRFKDMYQTSADNALLEKVLNSRATDILVIYNLREQYDHVHKHFDANIFNDGRVFEIVPQPSWRVSRFETETSKLKQVCVQMGTLVKNKFGSKKKINLQYAPSKPTP